jgi:hypothetical protein
MYWDEKLNNSVCFREPDIGNQITALAYLSYGDEFKELSLM